jgi:epoxyqueuosine reductase
MAGLGCIGKNNLLVTPQFGPRQRLRVMLIDADIPATEPIDFDPCLGCAMPCRKACPQKAFDHVVYSKEEYGLSLLPGRTGRYNRFECNRQMDTDVAGFEMIPVEGRDLMSKQVKYCRECERACPVGTD